MNWLWVIASLTILLEGYRCKDPTITLDKYGVVEGETVSITIEKEQINVDQFLGIPYAQAPEGNLRFAAPQKHPGWNDKLIAKKLPATCWQILPSQFELKNAGARMWTNNTLMSEDCLYLNIWTPSKKTEEKLPVMVWIYGGGFFSGSSTLNVYNGTVLAATQNVVVVSMQYRVGAFGFLHVAEEGSKHTQSATGNEGLMDQALALEWVKDNIEKFGGNSNSVTIFGESAGAVSVSILWMSPKTRNLFQRAIMQSASIYARWAYSTREDARKRGNAFISACGCDPQESKTEILNCLRKINQNELVKKLDSIYNLICDERKNELQLHLKDIYGKISASNISTCLYFDAYFKPVVDGHFLPSEPDQMFQNPEQLGNPELLIGVNRNEGMYFLLYGLLFQDATFLSEEGIVELPPSITQHHQKGDLDLASIGQFIDKKFMVNENVAKHPAYYYGFAKDNETSDSKQLMQRMDELTGDLDFICPTLQFADKVAAIPKAKVYFYSFQRRTEKFPMPDWVGVMHGYEIEYVFGMPRSDQFGNNFYTFTTDEKKISDKVMRLWSNFARYGNPTSELDRTAGLTNWPQYRESGSEQTKYLKIESVNFTMETDLRKRACEFWWKTMPEALKSPGKS